MTLRSIRFGEVVIFQASPLIGIAFAGGMRIDNAGTIALFGVANCLLFAHVFALNDWGNLDADLLDPDRARATFSRHGVPRRAMLVLATGLALAAVGLFARLGLECLLLSACVILLSVLYSHPRTNYKGSPFVSSLIHFAGGIVPFLLGYAAIRPIGQPAVALGAYFAIVLMAGHLVQESRDFDGDKQAGIMTNAVRFGRRKVLLASAGLFAASYSYLAWLAAGRLSPAWWAFLVALWLTHAAAWSKVWASPLHRANLARYQTEYRAIFGCIGIAMVFQLIRTAEPVL